MREDPASWPAGRKWLALGGVALFFGWIWLRSFSVPLGDRSLLGWTWAACSGRAGFLHARLVPLLFAGMVWWWTRLIRDEKGRPSYWGLIWLVLGMLIYLAGVRLAQPRVALVGMPFLVVGLAQYCLGGCLAKRLAPTAFFLLFLIPVPGLEFMILSSLKMHDLQVTADLGQLLGMEVTFQKGVLRISDVEFAGCFPGDFFRMHWMLMCGVAIVVFYRGSGWKKWALFLMLFAVIWVVRIGWLLLICQLMSSDRGRWVDSLLWGNLGIVLRLVVFVGLVLLVGWLIQRVRMPRCLSAKSAGGSGPFR